MKRTEVAKKVNELLTGKLTREKHLDRLDVLDKVKPLKQEVELGIFTREEIADYFDTDVNTIKKYTLKHNEELRNNGLKHYTREEMLEVVGKVATLKEMVDNKTTKGITTITVKGIDVVIPNRGVRMFDKKAVLNLALLMDDNDIAYEIQLGVLGIKEEDIEEDVIVLDTRRKNEDVTETKPKKEVKFDFEYAEDIENELMLKIVKLEDKVERAVAVQEFREYKEREKQAEIDKIKETYGIREIEEKQEAWDKRKVITKLARKLSTRTNRGHFITGWAKIFEELLHEYGINVNARKMNYKGKVKNPTVFDVLDNKEMDYLVEAVRKLVKENELNIVAMVEKDKAMEKELKEMGIM